MQNISVPSPECPDLTTGDSFPEIIARAKAMGGGYATTKATSLTLVMTQKAAEKLTDEFRVTMSYDGGALVFDKNFATTRKPFKELVLVTVLSYKQTYWDVAEYRRRKLSLLLDNE